MSKKNDKISLHEVGIKAPASSKAKNPVIAVTGEFSEKIQEYRTLGDQIKVLKARHEELGGGIREEAQSLWIERAIEGQTENIKLNAEDQATLTYIVMDSYAKVSEEALESIEAAGLSEYVERDQIQLAPGLPEETQQRILSALVAEFGKDRALTLVQTQYKIRKGSLLKVVESYSGSLGAKSRKMIAAAFEFLRPTTQLR